MGNDVVIPGVGTINLDPGVEIGMCNVLELNDDIDTVEARSSLPSDIRVSVASNIQEATSLLEGAQFDCVIVDINLGEQSSRGDTWLIDNLPKLSESKVVVLTGFRNQITHETELANHNIEIIDKASDAEPVFWRNLKRLPEWKRREQASAILEALNAHSDAGPLWPLRGAIHEDEVYESARDSLIDWLESRIDYDSKVVSFNGKDFSIRELAGEIRGNTKVGRMHVKLFIASQFDSVTSQMSGLKSPGRK